MGGSMKYLGGGNLNLGKILGGLGKVKLLMDYLRSILSNELVKCLMSWAQPYKSSTRVIVEFSTL